MEETQPLKRFNLGENKRRILIAIAQNPRKIRSFTHGDFLAQMNPDVIGGWLSEMVAHGLIYEAKETYHITVKGRQKLDDNRADEYRVAALRNTVTTGNYVPDKGQYFRPGSDHSHIKSKGQSC
jgi:DNA-binding PadR family transcriptional regulator